MITISLDSSAFWSALAAGASYVSMWAQSKVSTADPVADLTDRLRNPRRRVLWAVRHPIKTWKR